MLLRGVRKFATTGRRLGRRTPPSSALVNKSAPPPPSGELWQPVKDKASGQVYWWNTNTDETTALGAPKPVGASALGPVQQQGGSSLLGMVAEGMAFGTGAHLAGRAVSSLFGGGSSGGAGTSSGPGGSEQGGEEDDWDV